jgi:hypothetical protein
MREGYRFLDEKRLILAAEILGQLRRYEEELAAFRGAYAAATEALQGAVARHGLEGLELYPPAPALGGQLRVTPSSVLGVTLHGIACEIGQPVRPAAAVDESPEAARCSASLSRAPRASQCCPGTSSACVWSTRARPDGRERWRTCCSPRSTTRSRWSIPPWRSWSAKRPSGCARCIRSHHRAARAGRQGELIRSSSLNRVRHPPRPLSESRQRPGRAGRAIPPISRSVIGRLLN